MHDRAPINIQKIIVIDSEAKAFDAKTGAKYSSAKRGEGVLYVFRIRNAEEHHKLYVAVRWGEEYDECVGQGQEGANDWLVIEDHSLLLKCKAGTHMLRNAPQSSSDSCILTQQVFEDCEQFINQNRDDVFSKKDKGVDDLLFDDESDGGRGYSRHPIYLQYPISNSSR